MHPYARTSGFTLIELVMTIAILAVIASMTVSFLQGASDAERWEETRAKLEAIRAAILGDTRTDGLSRNHYGYHGDMGRMPASLNVLTAPEAPSWSVDTYSGIGAGWRGPYFDPKFTGGYALHQDAWGQSLVYSTTSLSSLGADNAKGGAGFDTDITVTFPANERLATVRGRLAEAGSGLANEVILVRYPVNGTLTQLLTTTDSNGAFQYVGIPFGRRAVEVTSLNGGSWGAMPFMVDQPQVSVAPNLTNRHGRASITYNEGSVVVTTSTISVNKALQRNQTTNASTITLPYTVPGALGTSLALLVAASGEDDSKNVIPTKAVFGTIPMVTLVTDYSGYSFNGYSAGAGFFIVGVTSGQKGTVTATFTGKNDLRGIAAYTLSEVDSLTPEAVAVFKNQDGNTTGIFTTQTDGAMVASYAHTGNNGTFTAVGSGHTIDLQQNISGQDSCTVIGHLLATTAATYAPVGFTHTNPNRMLTLMAAFRSTGRTVSATLSSTYESTQTLAYVTVRWSNGSVLRNFSLNNVNERVARVPSGTRLKINGTMTVPAGATAVPLDMLFSTTMPDTDFVVTFDWISGLSDTIRFTTP